MYYWDWISNKSNNLSIIKHIHINVTLSLYRQGKFSNKITLTESNLYGQIFLTDSILDIFVLEIWDHSLGWVGKRTHQNSPIVTNFHQISPIWTNLDQIWKHHLDFPYCNTVYIWQCKFRNAEMNTLTNKRYLSEQNEYVICFDNWKHPKL